VFFLPIKAGLKSCDFDVLNKNDNHMFSIKVPDFQFIISRDMDIAGNISISLPLESKDNVASLVKELSSGVLEDQRIRLHGKVPITVWGFTVYPGLSLYKDLQTGRVENNIGSIYNTLPPMAQVAPEDMSTFL
jgi:hypothetical protein